MLAVGLFTQSEPAGSPPNLSARGWGLAPVSAAGSFTGTPTGMYEETRCPSDGRTFLRLFEDAQVRPTYQNRAPIGVQIFDVGKGSFWETLGLRTGDLITEMNHEPIDSPEASVDLLRYVGNAPIVHLKVHALDGRDRQISWDAPPAPAPAALPERCRS